MKYYAMITIIKYKINKHGIAMIRYRINEHSIPMIRYRINEHEILKTTLDSKQSTHQED